MAQAILLTGGNEGDVAAALAAARDMMRKSIGSVATASSLYRSAPWGDFDTTQKDFLNQALIVETHLTPVELLDATQRIEQELGRQRISRQDGDMPIPNTYTPIIPKGGARNITLAKACFEMTEQTCTAYKLYSINYPLSIKKRRVYSSRPIDIDILFYDDLVMQTGRLTIPHPLIQEREFVLEPLAEIAPGYRHPVLGITVDEMLQRLRADRTPL